MVLTLLKSYVWQEAPIKITVGSQAWVKGHYMAWMDGEFLEFNVDGIKIKRKDLNAPYEVWYDASMLLFRGQWQALDQFMHSYFALVGLFLWMSCFNCYSS